MTLFPRTLLQIHYHDRPCGVTQVIRWYAQAFLAEQGRRSALNLLFCAHDRNARYGEFPQTSLIPCAHADYREFKDIRTFQSVVRIMERRLLAAFSSSGLPGPVAIIAHNLFLCKNAALTAAFANVARKLGTDPRYRFFSVVHDLPEEGRVGRLKAIAGMERMGIPVCADRALPDGAVGVITVNRRMAAHLKQADVPAYFLGNPVIMQKCRMNGDRKKYLMDRLQEYCRERRIMFDPCKPVYCYPSRTIARKNPIEAIALACLLFEGNLLLGPSGRSPRDASFHAALEKMISRYSLPVVTDIPAVFRNMIPENNPVPYVYDMADAALSTSIAESFGYLLYEPFFLGKPVLGRRPAGFSYPAGVRNSCLYSRLPVPAAWISRELLLKHYRSIGRACFGNAAVRNTFNRRVATLLSGNTVDFALLDDGLQLRLLKRILASYRMKAQWIALLEKKHEGWPGLMRLRRGLSATAIDHNWRIIEHECSMKRFQKEFRRSFSVIPALATSTINRDLLQEKFSDPRVFRWR
jgi:hypothetical protein